MMAASFVAVAGAIVLGGTAGFAADEVKIDQALRAVRATIERETQGGRVKEIEHETMNGRAVYEVEFVQGNKECDIHVAQDGTLVRR